FGGFGGNKQPSNVLIVIFFFFYENGVEKDFQITNWVFPMRVGHNIPVFTLLPNFTKNKYLFVAIRNTNVGDTAIHYEMIKEFSQSCYAFALFMGIGLVVVS
ncbi:hypothetical protein, partial [Kingella kingae]|uniref:hypothetical protein n=1 Tax=Kingella kingae TaxID=504 RepID=UPI001E40FABE